MIAMVRKPVDGSRLNPEQFCEQLRGAAPPASHPPHRTLTEHKFIAVISRCHPLLRHNPTEAVVD
jgi:hypothetical protein